MGDRSLDRTRCMVTRWNALTLILIFLGLGQVFEEACHGGEGSAVAVKSGDLLPYRIVAHVAIAPETRIDGRGRELLLDTWLGLVKRFVGGPWDLTIAEGD